MEFRSGWSFGPIMKICVQAFQGNHKLTQDGIIGHNTWRFILLPLVQANEYNL
ncbi:MAG: peptidoglycan-binding domain-containing protein [Clostridiaceae bacterium]|nr:peptidoglycan-binding domain-containing protein [Clostridiaceae bacterium]